MRDLQTQRYHQELGAYGKQAISHLEKMVSENRLQLTHVAPTEKGFNATIKFEGVSQRVELLAPPSGKPADALKALASAVARQQVKAPWAAEAPGAQGVLGRLGTAVTNRLKPAWGAPGVAAAKPPAAKPTIPAKATTGGGTFGAMGAVSLAGTVVGVFADMAEAKDPNKVKAYADAIEGGDAALQLAFESRFFTNPLRRAVYEELARRQLGATEA